MKLFIIRHAQTYGNKHKRIQGHLPGKLDDVGEWQTNKLVNRFHNEKIDALYSSDLARALETVNPLQRAHKLPVNTDFRLREWYFGSLQGKPYPSDWDWKNMPLEVETDYNMVVRASGFLEDLFLKHEDETVLCMTHGGVKIAFYKIFTALPGPVYSNQSFKNASVSLCHISSDTSYSIQYLHCTQHLE